MKKNFKIRVLEIKCTLVIWKTKFYGFMRDRFFALSKFAIPRTEKYIDKVNDGIAKFKELDDEFKILIEDNLDKLLED